MKRSRNILSIIYVISLIAVVLVVINVFLVTIFKVHIRSNTSLDPYVQNVSTVSETIHAKRGNIYSSGGEVVAQDVKTYDIICYLSDTRVKANNEPAYVTDPDYTSRILATILDGDASEIYRYLTNHDLYQTEIGIIGRNISEETKAMIDSYDLPGIGYRTSYTRTYPRGENFAPYLIGFAQSDETGKLVGKMGLEEYMNSELSGIDGYHVHQQDKNGYNLPGMYEETSEAKNGYDVYTTIDASIQDALVTSFEDLAEGVGDSWGSVVEIDTGKILAWAQKPSFDPNVLDIESYNNLGTQLPYEPGSVFKSFIYAAAMDLGVYDGEATYNSEKFCYLSGTNNEPFRTYSEDNYGCISNANGKNWGTIPLDYGLIYSSNVATSTLLTNYLGSANYLDYVKKFGFFKGVDSDGIAEDIGLLNFTWPSEKLSLTYGQGSSVTMFQLLQAYSAIFGNGEMVKPYFVDKIIDSDTGKLIYHGSRTVVDQVIKEDTAKKMQDLLYRVVYDQRGTASIYKVDEVEILAKTGTAEAMSSSGEYYKDLYINSVMLALPADNPKYMIYYAYVFPYDYGNVDNTGAIKSLIKKVALLTNVNYDSSEQIETEIYKYEMPNVLNIDVYEAASNLRELGLSVNIIGDGDKVIKQYPNFNENVYTNEKVFLLTDGDTIELPDFTGWSRKELIAYWNMTGFAFNLDGYGVCYNQSIEKGSIVSGDDEITVYFKQIDSYVDTSNKEEIEVDNIEVESENE